jgi:phosphatidate phosphatase APP1
VLDIDDTTKISDVLNRLKLLRHTFLDKHGQPVPGMPELYRSLEERLCKPTFFYLSASPWQLYLFLLDFIRTNYPFGQIILRDMSFVELSSFVATLTIGTQEYKEDEMEKIHQWFPKKQFICIGDSAQTDPEAYGTT